MNRDFWAAPCPVGIYPKRGGTPYVRVCVLAGRGGVWKGDKNKKIQSNAFSFLLLRLDLFSPPLMLIYSVKKKLTQITLLFRSSGHISKAKIAFRKGKRKKTTQR